MLAAWIVVLVLTLHNYDTVTHWRMAQVGFGIVESAAFAATARACWRGRQLVVACLLATGTPLLCCDAWFDVVLDLHTGGMWPSIASGAAIELPPSSCRHRAAAIELPLALLLLNAARHRIWRSALVAVSERDGDVHLPSLWRRPLVGENAAEKAGARE